MEGGMAGRRERRREGEERRESGGRDGRREERREEKREEKREGKRGEKGQFCRLATRQCFRSFLQTNLSPSSVQLHTVTLQAPEGSVHIREWPCTSSQTSLVTGDTLM